MSVRILTGDVFHMLPTIEPGSIDCAVTSPPYWQLRSYLPKDHPLKRFELGSEKTPAEYVANMVKVLGLVRDCLADHGTLWLNVGDSYANSGCDDVSKVGGFTGARIRAGVKGTMDSRKRTLSLDAGNLCLIPQRLMIALQDDGWIVRSVIVWHKPAPMPSSVQGWSWRRCRIKTKAQAYKNGVNGDTICPGSGRRTSATAGNYPELRAEWSDCPGCPKCSPNDGLVLRRGSWRPTSSWEPVIMLAKSAKYFCDGEAVKTQAAAATIDCNLYSRVIDDPDEQFAAKHDHECTTTTANARDVQTWASEPLKHAHYASFPTALPDFCLRAGTSSKGYCATCGGPWVRVIADKTESTYAKVKGEIGWREMAAMAQANGEIPHRPNSGQTRKSNGSQPHLEPIVSETLGWRPSCRCKHNEPRPGRVLDPFGGSGRTAIAAMRLGLDATLVELNPEYAEMARKIIYKESPLFSGAA